MQLPCFEAESDVGSGPVPLDPLEPPPELLPEVPLDEPVPESSPPEPELDVPRIELPLELDADPELAGSEPLELEGYAPLELFEPDDEPWLPLLEKPPLGPGLPVEVPPHAPRARHGANHHVEAQVRAIMLRSLS